MKKRFFSFIILLSVFIVVTACSPTKSETHSRETSLYVPQPQTAVEVTENRTNEAQTQTVSTSISGTWHRNSLFNTAELTINDNMEFSLNASGMANFGFVEGKIIKTGDGRYVSTLDGELYDEKTTFVFLHHANYIELIVEGEQIGAGNRVFYDGKYEKQPMTSEEFFDKGLEHIIGNNFNKIIVKQLLGDDLEYFITCFGVIGLETSGNRIIKQGFMPGIAPWQNGIIKIENNNIYILITDCREDVFKYYTNDTANRDIPDEFRDWVYFNAGVEIIKR